METATISPLAFTFRSWTHLLGSRHILVFYNGVCVQHLCTVNQIEMSSAFVIDLTQHSRNIGRFDAEVRATHPHFKIDDWAAPIWFFDREDDLDVYLASRYEMAKDSDLSTHAMKCILWAIKGHKAFALWKDFS